MPDLLYLSSADIERLRIPTDEVIGAVEAMFRQKSLGHALQRPKLSLSPSPGGMAQALLGMDRSAQLAAVKCVSVTPDNAARGLPNVQALIVLTETVAGQVRAIMNGTWITGVRTAACSAVGARYLASPEATSIGFVGAGLQARTHLDALLAVCPRIERVTVHSRTVESAEALLALARSRGLEARHAVQARDAVAGHDIVVSSVAATPGFVPFLDPAWVSPGTYVAAVDLGCSWLPDQWGEAFDIVCTDDIEQSEMRGRAGTMLAPDRFDTELGDVILGRKPGRGTASQKTTLLFAGTALADLAVASLVDQSARRQGVGAQLPA